MHPKIASYLLLSAALAAAPAWAVNKCPGPYGRVIFQDAPCQGSETVREDLEQKFKEAKKQQALEVKERERQAQMAANHKARIEREEAEAKAEAAKVVRIGMTSAEVRANWGEPSGVNTTTTSYGTSEQWIYRRGSYRTQYVYLSNDVVTSTQSTKNY